VEEAMSEKVSQDRVRRIAQGYVAGPVETIALASDCLDARRERDAARLLLDQESRLRAFDTGSAHLTAGQMLEFARLDEMWQRLVQELDSARRERDELEVSRLAAEDRVASLVLRLGAAERQLAAENKALHALWMLTENCPQCMNDDSRDEAEKLLTARAAEGVKRGL
jgi:hypothetical protein